MQPVLGALSRHKHFILLAALVGTLVVQPLTHHLPLGTAIYELFLSVALLIVLVIYQRRRERFAALAIVVVAIVCNWGRYFAPASWGTPLEVASHSLVALFVAISVTVILRELLAQRVIRTDHVIGAFCGYLLAGFAWGNLYWLADCASPDSLRVRAEFAARLDGEPGRRFIFNDFSFCNLTALGSGNIAPSSPVTSALSWLEAAFGQFYVAVFVAQLVGMRLAQAVNRHE